MIKNMFNKLNLKYLFLFIFLFCNYENLALAEKKTIKIGSGSILEGYYSLGLKLCDFFTEANQNQIKCEVIPTNGSIENLKLLKEKKIDLALIQSNIAVDAFEGKGAYAGQLPSLELRQLLNFYEEIFTIIVKDDDKIKVFSDLAGKRITNGPPGSASTVTYQAVRDFYSFAKPIDIELSQEEYAKKLCEGEIDAVMLMTGHPSALVSHIANNCNVEFVTIERDKLARVLGENKAFKKAILKAGFYPGITQDQETLGVSAILITTDKFDDKILNNFEEYCKKNLKSLKNSLPQLIDLDENHFFENFVLPKF